MSSNRLPRTTKKSWKKKIANLYEFEFSTHGLDKDRLKKEKAAIYKIRLGQIQR